jgi:hypothetical protein
MTYYCKTTDAIAELMKPNPWRIGFDRQIYSCVSTNHIFYLAWIPSQGEEVTEGEFLALLKLLSL